MNFLSRTDVLKLTDDTNSSFDGKGRNLRLPELQPDVTGRKRGKYTPLEALIMIISNQLYEGNGINQTRAAHLASHAYFIASKIKEIADTSEMMARGVTPQADIFVAWMLVSQQQQFPEHIAACGTLAQIAKKFPSPTSITLMNVTRCAAAMRNRAGANIDLGELWTLSSGNQSKGLAVHAYGETIKAQSVYAARAAAREPTKDKV